jgi:ATP-dependent protease HslVU (ClpYQ) peptidase subunit
MTCVVAVTDGKKVVIGADSAFSREDSVIVTDFPPKAWRVGSWILGFCGDMSHICKCKEELRDESWKTVGELLESVRDIAGKGASFDLVAGKEGKLYSAESCGAWYRIQDRRAGRKIVKGAYAVGSGAQYALGSLYSTFGMKSDVERIKLALNASVYYTSGVRPPFRIVSE